MKKIERLHHEERNGDYRREISSIDSIIDTVNSLVDSNNELLETHTVKEVCICYQLSRHSKDPEMFCSCQCHGTKEEPTTPEKKCCEKCQRMGRRNETPTVYDVPLPCTSSCPCHQEESEKRNDIY